jgi:hypothetical protein
VDEVGAIIGHIDEDGNSDWNGSHLQERYLSGRVDIVVVGNKLSAVHEM